MTIVKGYIFSQNFLTTNDIYQVSNKLNNGITIQYWWKRFSYDWIGLFSQDKLDNGDEIKFHYVSDIDRIRYHTWTDCWGGPYPDCAIHWKDRWTELIEKNIWQIAT